MAACIADGGAKITDTWTNKVWIPRFISFVKVGFDIPANWGILTNHLNVMRNYKGSR